MAEQGAAKEVKKEEGTTGQEPISQSEADKIFTETLQGYTQEGGEKKPAPEGKKDEGAPKQDGGTPTDGIKPEPVAEDKRKQEEAENAAAKEEAEFVKSLGLPEGTKVPKELMPVFKKFQSDLEFERHEKRRWGEQNKQLADRLKSVEGEHQKLALSQPITADDIKAFREKHKGMIAGLPAGAQKLWADDDYVADKIATLRAMAGDVPVEQPKPGTGQPAGGGQPVLTEEQAQQEIVKNIQKIVSSDIIKKSHPDIADVYGSPDFVKWTESLSDIEAMKIFSSDPRAHKEILDRYKAEKAWAKEQADTALKNKEKQNALGGLGDVNSGGRTAREETPDDIMRMSDEEYNKRKNAAFARAGG